MDDLLMRFAYADPPYIGQAKKHYGREEVDHAALIASLAEYDGWALSCSSPSLREILPMCPENARVAAWVKPFAFFKGSVRPPYAWEPLIFVTPRTRDQRTKGVRDWLRLNVYGVTPAERAAVDNVKGMKREEFCIWLFELLRLYPNDELVDLYPGSGAVTKAWNQWREMGS